MTRVSLCVCVTVNGACPHARQPTSMPPAQGGWRKRDNASATTNPNNKNDDYNNNYDDYNNNDNNSNDDDYNNNNK